MEFTVLLPNKPVISIPVIPPIPWHANTSSGSSYLVLLFRNSATTFETIAAMKPINIACGTPTKAAAVVMATRPTTAPIQNPRTDGFLPRSTSRNIQERPAVAAAVFVVANAYTPNEPAPAALPALNPNQPNHSKPVPIRTYGMLAGCAAGVVLRGLSTNAPARAAIPAEI